MAEYKNGFNAFGGMPVDSSRRSPELHTGRAVYINDDEYSDEPNYKNKADSIVREGYHKEAPFEAPEIIVPEPIIPSGTKNITENGTYDVTQFAKAEVNVASGGSSDLLSQVATVIKSVPASENTGTFSNGTAEIAIAPIESTGHSLLFVDSVTIEVNGQTKTLNSYPMDSSVEGAVFDDGATAVIPSVVEVGDSTYIGFHIADNTYSRTDSITVKYSAFNVYTPNDDIIAIYPSLAGGTGGIS